ncbi:hypothetical protein, partial [Escherichia coli]|uniref:hypothetical protein n=1 Tax=Escherichia coli TaxID=562 RepID=UPI001A7E11ED
DGHYFCRAGGNRPDGLNEPVTFIIKNHLINLLVFFVNASYLTVICNCFEPMLPKPSVSALLKLKVIIFRLSQ